MVRDPVQEVVDELAARLRRSVVINDAGVHLLYASAHYGDEDAVRIRAVLQREADGRAIGHVLAQSVATWTTAGIIPPNPELAMKARVCLPVRWRGDLLGLLMVMDGDGTLTTGELAVIGTAATEVAPLLAPQAPEDSGAVLDLIADDPALRRRALADLDADFTTVTAIEVGVPGEVSGPVAAHAETALRSALSQRSPAPGKAIVSAAVKRRLTAVSGGVAVILLDGPAPPGYAEGLLARVHDLAAGRFSCVAGIGSPAPGLDRAFESAAQARLARRAAATVLRRPIVTWPETGPYGVLLRIPPAELTEAALPAELHRLTEADPTGALTRTVRAYLDHAGNGPAAAEALHIHRTTLYYRLGRVRDLTALNLDDGPTRLTLHLGLALTDLLTTALE